MTPTAPPWRQPGSETCQSEELFMRVRISIVLAALAVTMVLPGVAAARGGNAAAAAKAEHDRITAYWTPARIAAAHWKDYRVDPKSGKITPYAKPGGGGGGASWTGNGAIEQRSGRILFSTSAGDWICSGSVVNTTSGSAAVVLTAGHCVYDGSEGWSFNFMYIPDFDDAPTYTCNQTVYGCWTATRLAINSDFYPSGFGPDSALRVDYGFALVGAGGHSGTADLDTVTGGYGLNTATVSNNTVKWAFGYPAAGRYHGKDLTYCTGSTVDDPYGVGTWGMVCNMTGGSSGGPWIYGTTNPAIYSAGTLLTSVNSYGYSGLNYMFGPRFNAETATVFGDVQDGTATSGASVVH
jgi:V8-like Glu-specific endopeptidase